MNAFTVVLIFLFIYKTVKINEDYIKKKQMKNCQNAKNIEMLNSRVNFFSAPKILCKLYFLFKVFSVGIELPQHAQISPVP